MRAMRSCIDGMHDDSPPCQRQTARDWQCHGEDLLTFPGHHRAHALEWVATAPGVGRLAGAPHAIFMLHGEVVAACQQSRAATNVLLLSIPAAGLLAAEQPQNRAQNDADEERGSQRHIEMEILALDDDVAGEVAKPKFCCDRPEHAQRDEHKAEDDEELGNLHSGICRSWLAKSRHYRRLTIIFNSISVTDEMTATFISKIEKPP